MRAGIRPTHARTALTPEIQELDYKNTPYARVNSRVCPFMDTPTPLSEFPIQAEAHNTIHAYEQRLPLSHSLWKRAQHTSTRKQRATVSNYESFVVQNNMPLAY